MLLSIPEELSPEVVAEVLVAMEALEEPEVQVVLEALEEPEVLVVMEVWHCVRAITAVLGVAGGACREPCIIALARLEVLEVVEEPEAMEAAEVPEVQEVLEELVQDGL